MKLTQLAIEAWMISVCDNRNSNLPPLSSRDRLYRSNKTTKTYWYVKKYLSLQVLEVDDSYVYCSFNDTSDNKLRITGILLSISYILQAMQFA